MNTAVLSEEVARAIEELESAFAGPVTHEPDDVGGAYVTVEKIELGPKWAVEQAPLTLHLAYNYPDAAIYPFYLPDGVVPADGSMPQALQPVRWRDQAVMQLSLRHNNWDPRRDNAVGAVMQAQAWLRAQ